MKYDKPKDDVEYRMDGYIREKAYLAAVEEQRLNPSEESLTKVWDLWNAMPEAEQVRIRLRDACHV